MKNTALIPFALALAIALAAHAGQPAAKGHDKPSRDHCEPRTPDVKTPPSKPEPKAPTAARAQQSRADTVDRPCDGLVWCPRK